MNLWDESEIEIINGDKYLNEEASQRVYEKYEKYLSKYKDSKFRKFRVESVSKLIEYFSSLQHDDTSKDLETDEKKLLELLLKMYFSSYASLFNYIVFCYDMQYFFIIL